MKKIISLVLLLLATFSLIGCTNKKDEMLEEYKAKYDELIEYKTNIEAQKEEEKKLIDEYVEKCVNSFGGSHYYAPRMVVTVAVEKPINDYNTEFDGEKPNYDYVIRVYGSQYCDVYLCSDGEIEKYVSIDLLKITK